MAVTSPVQAELDAAVAEFGSHIRTYLNYDEMLRAESSVQAVVVSSATAVHAEQSIKAIEKGLHVLCEKPLSTNAEVVSQPRLSPSISPSI